MTSARKMTFVLESLESADMSINSICSDFGNQRTSLFSNRGRGEFVRNELRCMGLFPCVPLVVLYQSLRGRPCTISKSHRIHRQCLMLVSFPPRNWVGCYLPLLPAWVPMPASNFFASLKIARFYAHMFLPVYAHVCSTDPSCSLMGPRWLSYPILLFSHNFRVMPHARPSTWILWKHSSLTKKDNAMVYIHRRFNFQVGLFSLLPPILLVIWRIGRCRTLLDTPSLMDKFSP